MNSGGGDGGRREARLHRRAMRRTIESTLDAGTWRRHHFARFVHDARTASTVEVLDAKRPAERFSAGRKSLLCLSWPPGIEPGLFLSRDSAATSSERLNVGFQKETERRRRSFDAGVSANVGRNGTGSGRIDPPTVRIGENDWIRWRWSGHGSVMEFALEANRDSIRALDHDCSTHPRRRPPWRVPSPR